MLHTVNKLDALANCLQLAQSGDAVLLMNEAVSAARNGSLWTTELADLASHCELYVLQEGRAESQTTEQLIPAATAIGFSQFVTLTVEHQHTQSWY